jgi:hypothetical protein
MGQVVDEVLESLVRWAETRTLFQLLRWYAFGNPEFIETFNFLPPST